MAHSHRIVREPDSQPQPLTPKQLHILQHSLGVDKHGRGDMYRNYFGTSRTCPDGLICLELVLAGYMTDHGPQVISGGTTCFTVTAAGKDAVRSESPPPPKLTRGKRMYRYWLEISDSYPDYTFGDFLRLASFAPQRKRALT